MDSPAIDIQTLSPVEAGELMTLRRAAFAKAALAAGGAFLPVTQSLQEIVADLAAPDVVTLGARAAGRLVASVRIAFEGNRAVLSLLAVVPDLHHKGFGVHVVAAVPEHLRASTAEVWVAGPADDEPSPADGPEDAALGDLLAAYLDRIAPNQ